MVNPLSYFSFQPVHYNWCKKNIFLKAVVCAILSVGKSSPCNCSGFPLSLYEWRFTIFCLNDKVLIQYLCKRDIARIKMCGVGLTVGAERYTGLNIAERICTLYDRNELENEFHFITNCSM